MLDPGVLTARAPWYIKTRLADNLSPEAIAQSVEYRAITSPQRLAFLRVTGRESELLRVPNHTQKNTKLREQFA